MTIKQCNSCRYFHIWRKQVKETCFLVSSYFMSSKVCPLYKQGDFEEIREEYKRRFGVELK